MSIIESVLESEQRFYSAQTASDVAELAQIFADDLYFVHTTGATDTKASYLEAVRSGRYGHGEIYKLHGRTLVSDDESGAVSIGVVDMVTKAADQPVMTIRIHQVLVWERAGSGWRLKSRQATKQPL
jgi:ketosteroid isomerase-like protein